ncbi:signal peptide peptidase SppA, partial [Peptococcaceae bacterium]|nr:signal peptide peptidase SppA [Peptococcaceae bacterium]
MRRKIITGVIIGILMLFIALAVILQEDAALDVAISAKNEIGVIDITGVIVSGNSGSDFMGGTTTGSASVINQLRKVRENPNMPAVILYMNSPGGSPAACLEIGNEIKRLREEGKIVVTYMADIATSGAYWIACETDLIVANPSTMTGSIGVIMQIFNFEELYDMLGIDVNIIKSGEHKDMGATHRDVIEEEKRIFQSMVNDIYEQFIEVVSKGRNMEIEQVKKLADGRVYTGRQALELGLVDELGDMRDAI